MAFIAYFLLITHVILAATEPIEEGADVGTIKIHNGKQIVLNPGKFPYIAHLRFERIERKAKTGQLFALTSNCGGALIRRNVILSAAHCFGDVTKKPTIMAWLGILDTVLDQGKGQQIPVRGYTIHGSYDKTKDLNDIALLWLVYPARPDGKYVKIANLPTEDFVAEGKRGWIIGWGKPSCQQTTMLQKAVVRGVSPRECQKYYKHKKIVPNVICIMSDDRKKTSTRGDSGGPFIIQDTVVGVSSFGAVDWSKSDKDKGIFICDAKKPAAYTSVAKFIDWIEASIEDGPRTILLKTEPVSTIRPPASTLIPRVPPKRPQRKQKVKYSS